MARRTHRTWTWTFSSFLLGASATVMTSCGETTRSNSDAGLASAPNPNQPKPEDGGFEASFDGRDAASTRDTSETSVTDPPGTSEVGDPARTGDNFSLPGFGGGGLDAGTAATVPAPTNAAESSSAPSGEGSSRSLDAGATTGPDSSRSSAAETTVSSDAGPSCPACPASEDPCLSWVCNPPSGSCEATPNIGAGCDDDNACTDADQCDPAGQCIGILRDCPASTDECTVNACNPQSGSCETHSAPPTTACDDGDGCTVGDTCNGSGQCHGNAKDCSDLDDQCLAGACNAESGACEALPAHAGEDCIDDDPCTVDDVCDVDGVCDGTPKDCSQYDHVCVVGACNAETGTCEPHNAEDGSPCDDLTSCTTNDVCKAGLCGGIVPDTCSSGASLPLTVGSTTVVLDTSCSGVGDQFNIATYGGLPLPLPGEPASLGDCSQSSGPDVYLSLDLSSHSSPVRVQATTDHESTLFDTVLILMGADTTSAKQCGYNALAACNDDINRDKKQSRIDVLVSPGTYVLVVDGFISSKAGPVGLEVTLTPQ